MRRGKGTVACIVNWEWELAQENGLGRSALKCGYSATAAKDGDCTWCGMQSSSVTAVCALDRPSHSVVHLTQSHSTMEDR